jgi:hypothetical protein
MLGMVRVTLSTLWPTPFREAKFHGFDISKEGVKPARREARQMGLTNATFEVKEDIISIAESKKCRFITAFDTIYTRSGAAYAGVKRDPQHPFADGGIFLMQDIGASSNFHENIGNSL